MGFFPSMQVDILHMAREIHTMRAFAIAALPAIFFPTLLTSSHLEHRAPTLDMVMPKAESIEALEVIEESLAIEKTQDAEAAEGPAYSKQDVRCLALNIYHEARSETESGQVAVALVTLNRVASKAFPGSICAVVKQGGVKRNRCQFSWWCDGRSDEPTNEKAWQRAMRIARRVIEASVPDPTHGALYYHASYCKPSWSSAFKRTARIGQHLFYRPVKI